MSTLMDNTYSLNHLLKKWLKTDYIVRVIPYKRDNTKYITSDVWLGNVHINRQFLNYKIDNFIQAFEEWEKNSHFLEIKNDLIRAFHIAKPVIKDKKLKASFENWLESLSYQKEETSSSSLKDQSMTEREKLLKEIVKTFNQWKSKIKPEITHE